MWESPNPVSESKLDFGHIIMTYYYYYGSLLEISSAIWRWDFKHKEIPGDDDTVEVEILVTGSVVTVRIEGVGVVLKVWPGVVVAVAVDVSVTNSVDTVGIEVVDFVVRVSTGVDEVDVPLVIVGSGLKKGFHW